MNLQDNEQAVAALLAGSVGVMATDTVYGIVALARDKQAVERMYALKHREHKPGTLIAASVEQLRELGVPSGQLDAVEQWWPSPLSVVLDMPGNDYLHLGLGDVAMRVVADPTMRNILLQTGPLITSSANLPGQPTATTVAEAYAYFSNHVDFYVDGGDRSNMPPSTVARVTDNGIKILRQGAVIIPEEAIAKA